MERNRSSLRCIRICHVMHCFVLKQDRKVLTAQYHRLSTVNDLLLFFILFVQENTSMAVCMPETVETSGQILYLRHINSHV